RVLPPRFDELNPHRSIQFPSAHILCVTKPPVVTHPGIGAVEKRRKIMTRIDEVAANIFRISTYISDFDLQFNQFLIKDDEPLLFETGMKQLFPQVREAVSRVIDPASLRYISFSHFEPDECGSLNEWLTIAPRAEAVCSAVGAMVFVNDGAIRPARGLSHNE